MTATTSDTADLPRWRAVRDAVGAFNNIWHAGSISYSKTCPGPDWVRIGGADAVAEPSRAEPGERMPMAGFRRSGIGYNARLVSNRPAPAVGMVPLYSFTGKSLGIACGARA